MDEPFRFAAMWLLVGCAGCATARSATAEGPRADARAVSEVSAPEPAPPDDVARVHLETEAMEQSFLEGRLAATLPPGAALTASTAWFTRSATFDAYEFERGSCTFAFALRRDGRVRPTNLQPEGGEHWLPRGDPSMEIFVLPERVSAAPADEFAAVGAVAFEGDGTATDLWVWPLLPPGVASAVPDDGDDWLGAQRRDPRISNCFGEAERWLLEFLPTLRAVRPFASPSEITFGWDEARDDVSRYRATLPPGWVLSTVETYDDGLTCLHPRLPWARSIGTPTPSACLSLSSAGPLPSGRGRRARVLGHTLAFDADGCAGFLLGGGIAYQFLCLTGSPTERAAILEVLETFRPVSPTE